MNKLGRHTATPEDEHHDVSSKRRISKSPSIYADSKEVTLEIVQWLISG